MKKLTILAATAIAAVTFTACGNSTPKADLKNDIDTLSYALGYSQTQGLRDYLTRGLNVDTAYIDDFIKGLNDGANAGDDKKKAAYYAGVQIGQQISNQMVKGINHELFGEDSTKTISMKNFLSGFITGAKNKKGLMTQEEAVKYVQEKAEVIKSKSAEATYGANKEAGKKFLAENAKQPGVKQLPSGVQYKVIKGWTEVLTRMPAGSVWEVYIPEDQAYGSREQPNIKPFSTLVFKIELISVGEK